MLWKPNRRDLLKAGAAATAFGGIGATALAQDVPAAPEAGTLKMGLNPWLGYGQWHIAAKKDLFKAQGLEGVELVNFTTDADLNAALASGQLQCGNIATHTAMNFMAAGLPIKIVLLLDVSTTADAMISDGSITDIKSLKGLQVALEEGTTSDILLNYALAQNGMTVADVQKVPMPAADAGAALIAGQVDSAVTYEPYISEAVNQNADIKLLYTAAERSGLISDVLAASAPFAAENPDVMRNLLKVWGEAVDFLRANPEEGRAIIAEAVGSSPEELVTAFEGVAFYNLDENVQYLAFGSENAAAVFNDVQTIALAIGLIDEPVDLNQMVDANYLLTE